MEFLNGSVVAEKTQLFCKVSPFVPISSFPNQLRRNRLNFNKVRTGLFIKTPFSSSSLFSNGRRSMQISAQVRRVSRRRNSLRKKLSEEQQVRRNSESSIPGSNFQNPVFIRDELESLKFKTTSTSNLDESSCDDGVEKSKLFRDSVLWNKLETWVDQYKKDVEFWGIGSGPIFTVFQDSNGNVERVSVNEDEILRRSHIEPWCFKQGQLGGKSLVGVESKISHANALAREMESGEYKLPINSAIAKYVVSGKKSWFIDGILSVANRPNVFSKVSKFPQISFSVFCGCFIFWSLKKILAVGDSDVALTGEEKEILMRKMKLRMKKEKSEKGSVEVLPVVSNSLKVSSEKPKLDKEELMKNISKAKMSGENFKSSERSVISNAKSRDLDNKIWEIKEMARRARELERQNRGKHDNGDMNENFSKEKNNSGQHILLGSNSLNRTPDETTEKLVVNNAEMDPPVTDMAQEQAVESQEARPIPKESALLTSDGSNLPSSTGNESFEGLEKANHFNMKPMIIRSVVEAREYLSQKHHKVVHDKNAKVECRKSSLEVLDAVGNEELNGKDSNKIKRESTMFEPSAYSVTSHANSEIDAHEDTTKKTIGLEDYGLKKQDYLLKDLQGHDVSEGSIEGDHSIPKVADESWLVKNFEDFEPIVKKIGDGFRENYMLAKEKVQEELQLSSEITGRELAADDDEFEWMKDDQLREIVFQVRENELMGRDPFHMMDAEDKNAFFEGLERKVEKENAKLVNLHEWVHSKVENLDYGVDGISLYDPPEKVIPRWKGPSFTEDPEVLNKFKEQRKAVIAENARVLPLPVVLDAQSTLQKSLKSEASSDYSNTSGANNLSKTQQKKCSSKTLRTVIESSDGSARAGKKSGKEYWQHTKKWSREFLEAYNAETDPEVKSIMKDMGKDLDRWITDREIEEAADLLAKVPRRKRRYIEKRLDKLKKEMELFGPQAVVSKYREYAEADEQDYLWWLDLPFILCIELYTMEEGVQKVGFYSLEMAADLELDPKQYHVIAFEDSADSKNFCYIIQAHMEMLGNGNAFVVARPPKDAFREAKANGFSVTVIRKGELQLNVDQMLEEVEEQITEIGSKIYHDKIMHERSVDMGSLMKGVFAASKPTKRS